MCKLLRGPPKDLICDLPLTDSNYEIALRLLDENYDVPDRRQQDVLAHVVNLPSVRHAYDTVGLRELSNFVPILALATVNVPLHTIALTYEQTVRSALPISLILTFDDRQQLDADSGETEQQDQAAAAAGSLERLLSFLRRSTSPRERASTKQRNNVGDVNRLGFHDQKRPKTREAPRFPPRQQFPSTAVATASKGSRRQLKVRKNPCLFCGSSEHRPSVCSADLPGHRRVEILNQKKRCPKCFQFEHVSPRQCDGPKEACHKCGSKDHYTVMHSLGPISSEETARTAACTLQSVAAISTIRSIVMTASAFVVHGAHRIRVRCFIDSESMVSFVSPRLIGQLSDMRPQARVDLQLQAFASEHALVANRYAVQLVGNHDDSQKVVIQAHEYAFGVDPPANCSQEMRELIRQFGKTHQLADASLIDPEFDMEPDLLIGVDQMYKILHLNSEEISPSCPVHKDPRTHTAKDIQCLWSLDAVGIVDSNEKKYRAAEVDAMQQIKDSVEYDGQRYTVAMPKRPSILQVSNNLEIARNRLIAERRSLSRNQESFRRYDAERSKFLMVGHAEEVHVDNLGAPSARDRSYYLPHRQVIAQRAHGDKLRIVFDGSAAAPGETSLNSHLNRSEPKPGYTQADAQLPSASSRIVC
ncbi:uncharacterized protein LOC100897454 [Galendromus occidentalis]|uniref:Uncharacterized protein LOC100897454 n=1 Tax=Galendromus occidentalis TaxID=34638 RepID=A0AAJ6QW36_9ACAR|nr:uncharacterized protein LOC100897454 [Galendromus occidentalis]